MPVLFIELFWNSYALYKVKLASSFTCSWHPVVPFIFENGVEGILVMPSKKPKHCLYECILLEGLWLGMGLSMHVARADAFGFRDITRSLLPRFQG